MSESKVLTLPTDQSSLNQLADIQRQFPPYINNLSKAKKIYDIDLNTREVQAPKMLSVSKDHKSTVIYFRVDRYYDYMDLTQTICLIQYSPPGNKQKLAYTYVVPAFDTLSQADEGKIIFPWAIGGAATQNEGDIQFAIRFYQINFDDEEHPVLTYNLNTKPATSTISHGLQVDKAEMTLEYDKPLIDIDENGNQVLGEVYTALIAELSNQRTQWTILV